MTLRVGVDGSSLANPRGYGRFTREVLAELFADAFDAHWVLFVDARAEPSARALIQRIPGADTRVSVVVVPQAVSPTVAAASEGYRAPADMLRFTRAVWRSGVRLFFAPTVYTYFPLPPAVRALVCFHDTIAEDYPALTLPTRRDQLFWRAKTQLALWQSRAVLTVSDYSARRLRAVYGVAPDRLHITSEAASAVYQPGASTQDIEAARRDIGLPDGAPYFIYVGGFNPHKHVDVLIGAHAALRREGWPVQLVLVGPTSDVFHGSAPALTARLAQEGTQDTVRFAGFVPDDALRLLHTGATALVLPSECEGFGLPAVEAAACGTPVIATRNSPLPELLPAAGVFVPPRDESALTDAMRAMLSDAGHRAACAAAALRGAQALDWQQSAQATWTALRAVAA